MTNMWRRISVVVLCVLASYGHSQVEEKRLPNPFKRRTELELKQTGPYFGLQQGKYLIAEFGVERQWSQIRLTSKKTHALHGGFNYNFKYRVLGYDIGYWYRGSRVGLTWGGNICIRTDFDNTRVGIVPTIGYKVWQFHLQTGYHFLTPLPESSKFETNGLFVSLRFVLINDREFEWKRKEKNDGKIFQRN
jgi:hypothetical protein